MGEPMTFGEQPADWRADLSGLLMIGYLSGTFEWVGHRITLRTLTTDEELIVASLVKEWDPTIGAARAYATALAALAVVSIDDQPMPMPLGDTGGAMQQAIERFRYARRWYPTTIDIIYNRYLELELRARQVVAELGKDSAPKDATPGSSASFGSLTAEGSSGGVPSP
jgi:hypothetical protein